MYSDHPSIKIRYLDPLHAPSTSHRRRNLEKLTDDELLESVIRPKNGDPLQIDPTTGKLLDGNGRAYELQRRANDPNSTIYPDLEVPYRPYNRDNSVFYDME